MVISDLENQIEIAWQKTLHALREERWDEYDSAKKTEAALRAELAKERMKEYIQTQVFPIKSDDAQLLFHKQNVYVLLPANSHSSTTTVCVKFQQCILREPRDRSKRNLRGRILPVKGLGFSFLEEVENSDWVEEMKSVFHDRVESNPELWHSQKHFVMRFPAEVVSTIQVSQVSFEEQSFHIGVENLPAIYDCMAQSFETQVINKDIHETLAMVMKEIFAGENRA